MGGLCSTAGWGSWISVRRSWRGCCGSWREGAGMRVGRRAAGLGSDRRWCRPGGLRYIVCLFLCLGLAAQPASEAILRRAVQLHQAGDIEGAVAAYRSYLKEAPDSVMALSNLGAALSRLGRYEEAITEYRRALQKGADDARIRLNLALAYYKTAQIDTAAK